MKKSDSSGGRNQEFVSKSFMDMIFDVFDPSFLKAEEEIAKRVAKQKEPDDGTPVKNGSD